MFISEAFTWPGAMQSLTGGVLIGSLACMRLYCTKGLMTCATPKLWITTGTALFSLVFSHAYSGPGIFEPIPDTLGWGAAVGAGVLVGLGAKLGKGCTSGNGIQGLASMSLASLTHVLAFMGAGVAAATMLGSRATLSSDFASPAPVSILAAISVFGIAVQLLRKFSDSAPVVAITDLLAGSSFAAALILAQMTQRSKVIGFLDAFNTERGWDPSLMFVMGGALALAAPAYAMFGLLTTASVGVKEWAARPVDMMHVIGGLMFGAGWGISGLCPGPALVMCGTSSAKAIAFTTSMFGSRFVYENMASKQKSN